MNRKNIFIPFEGRVESCIKSGEEFEKGVELFKVEKRKLLASYYLPKDLEIRVEKTLDFITRIEGEYVSKDDVIAEKLISRGLMSKRITSDHDGIINLARASSGYLNILSELGTESLKSTFGGIVKDVNLGKGIIVETDVCEIPLFYSNHDLGDGTFGEFQILSDAESIPSSKKMQKSFEGKILFAGRFLYPEMATELFKRGCKFILVSSMNYDDLKGLDLPIGVLTGFGNIYFDSTKLEFFKEIEGSQISVLNSKLQFPVGLNDRISQLFEQNYYTVSIKKGDIVRSKDLEYFGLVGEVLSLNENENSATVSMQDGMEFSVDLENLEQYTEEFSLMRARIF